MNDSFQRDPTPKEKLKVLHLLNESMDIINKDLVTWVQENKTFFEDNPAYFLNFTISLGQTFAANMLSKALIMIKPEIDKKGFVTDCLEQIKKLLFQKIDESMDSTKH